MTEHAGWAETAAGTYIESRKRIAVAEHHLPPLDIENLAARASGS